MNLRTGGIAVSCSGRGNCAEPNVLIGTDWDHADVVFTKALKWQNFKDGVGRAVQEKEVCSVCQGLFGEGNFVSGVFWG